MKIDVKMKVNVEVIKPGKQTRSILKLKEILKESRRNYKKFEIREFREILEIPRTKFNEYYPKLLNFGPSRNS